VYCIKEGKLGTELLTFGTDILTFLNGNRTIIQDKSNKASNFIFSSKVLEYNEN
jgi:hypothetical protein